MQITFIGAAHEVTGSCSLVQTDNAKLLVDCGMFQGSDFNEGKNLDPLPFNPAELNAVFVTHAHLDHVGRLPLLVKGGFTGHFYATPPTMELAKLILEDALSIMTYDNKKFGRPILYSESDIAAVMSQFKTVEYGETVTIPPSNGEKAYDALVTFHDAGHIFGSAFIEIAADGKKIVFSGDVGNEHVPILKDTEMLPDHIDAMVCESTYGDRKHESTEQRQEIIERMVAEAIGRGGVLLIPSFSLERTQELIYELNDLIDRKKKLPRVPIYLDSPLAIGALRVYRKYPEYYDEKALKLYNDGDDLFEFPGLTMCETREESKKINATPGSKIIIAGAGMMNGGRVVHHALRYLSDERNTLLIIGYQSKGTLGREILDGKSPVNVLGEMVQVRCQVKSIGALSAHGDQDKLLNWIGGGKMTPKKVYLNHGDPASSDVLAKRIIDELGVKATVVNAGLTVEV